MPLDEEVRLRLQKDDACVQGALSRMLWGEAPNRRRKDNDYRSCTLLRGSNVPLHDEAGEFSYYR